MRDPDLESALSGSRHHAHRPPQRASRVGFGSAGLDRYTLHAIEMAALSAHTGNHKRAQWWRGVYDGTPDLYPEDNHPED